VKKVGHVPSYHLKAFNNLEDVVNSIVGKAGIFNPFTSAQIGIIDGKVSSELKVLNESNIKIDSNEELLISSILKLCAEVKDMEETGLIDKCRKELLLYKNNGGKQQTAYDIIDLIKDVYIELKTFDDDLIHHLYDELSDLTFYISGYRI